MLSTEFKKGVDRVMQVAENTITTNGFHDLTKLYDRFRNSPETIKELRNEKAMQLRGRRRYLARIKKNKNLATQHHVHALVNQKQEAVQAYLEAVIAEQQSGSGRQFLWYDQIKDVPVETLSVIALSTSLNAVGIGATLASALVEAGRAVEMESWSRWLRSVNKEFESRVLKKVMADHTSVKHRKRAMKNIARKEGYVREPWSKELCVKVGSLLMNAVIASTDLFTVWEKNQQTQRGLKTSKRIGFSWEDLESSKNKFHFAMSDDVTDRLDVLNEESSWLEPMLTPMVAPPVQWSTFDDLENSDYWQRTAGFYLDCALGAQVPMVRGTCPTQVAKIKRAINDGQMDDMVRALNLIQNTPFELNTDILEAVEWAWDTNQQFSKFPSSRKLDKLKFPDDDTWLKMSTEQRKGYILKARDIYNKNREIDGGLALKSQDLRTARALAKLPTKAFWVGASWDFRGRVYPIANFNHQRSDHIKAMFLLHNKKPIGEDGFKWLMLKCADLGDFDKISKASWNDRLQWADDNIERILEVARDFRESFNGDDSTKLYWSHADKPFGFLAACMEIRNVLTYGYEYESGFPIGLDGSNSGLQHFAALSLAADEADLVNLTPADKPQDLYEAVASVARQKIDKDKSTDNRFVREAWQKFKVGRKTLKRNVMTKNYGSNLYGFTTQIRDDFMKPINDAITTLGHWKGHKKNPFEIDGDKGQAAAAYLARKSWDSVNQVVKCADEGMSFIQQLCDACSAENKMMEWTTPMGFPVVNRYTKKRSKAIKVYLHDVEYGSLKRSQVTVREDLHNIVDSRKAGAACAANHTHSLDSAHLHATVLKCADEYGVTDLFLIHDSFATTPADTTALFNAVREAFVEQYHNKDIYQTLKDQVVSQLDNPEKADLPEVPKQGTLDLKQVLESYYCFI